MKKFNYKKVAKAAHDNPLAALSLGVSTASLGTSATNMTINAKRSKDSKEYQEKQIKAMNQLTDSLEKVDHSLKDKQEASKKRLISFRPKNFSKTLDYTLKGAKLGAGVGIVGSGLLPNKLGVETKGQIENRYKLSWVDNKSGGKSGYIETGKDGSYKEAPYYNAEAQVPKAGWDKGWRKRIAGIYNNSSDDVAMRKVLASLGSIAIGASLGFVLGAINDLVDLADRKNVDKRLMKRVLDDLKKMGFKDGEDYTTNPKTATLLKTKVCIGISRSADTLRVLVNTVNDIKLSKLAQETTKNLPSMSTRLERVSDRFNDINITTASGQGNSTFVSSIAEKFIRAGYPVQLVEVG